MANFFDKLMAEANAPTNRAASEATAQRIADAVELIAAAGACEFYTKRLMASPDAVYLRVTTDRLTLLVGRLTSSFLNRHPE